MAFGASLMVSWRTFGGHLGASWAPLATFGEHLCRSFGNLGGLLWALRPKYAPKTLPEPPRGPQETPTDTPKVARRSPKSSKEQPKQPQTPPKTMLLSTYLICTTFILIIKFITTFVIHSFCFCIFMLIRILCLQNRNI